MMKKSKIMLITTLAAVLLLAGCGNKDEAGLQIMAAGPYVDDGKAQDYAETLTSIENGAAMSTMFLSGNTVSADSEDVDAKAAGLTESTNLMKVTAMVAGKELDVMICDVDTAGRLVKNDMFLTLDELFNQEELAGISEELQIAYEGTDDDGNPTGEMLPACGIDVSDHEELKAFLPSENIGVYVISNAPNLETAKEYVLSLID